MKKLIAILLIITVMLSSVSVFATSTESDVLEGESMISKITNKNNETLKKYIEKYGDTYGWAAYILNIVQRFSIPVGFVGIAISGTLTYVINARNLAQRQRGWGIMIGFILFMAICQMLPLLFALAFQSWG